MPPRKKSKYKTVHEGRVETDTEYGTVLWLVEQTFNNTAYGVAAGGLVDVRLMGKRIRVTVEEL